MRFVLIICLDVQLFRGMIIAKQYMLLSSRTSALPFMQKGIRFGHNWPDRCGQSNPSADGRLLRAVGANRPVQQDGQLAQRAFGAGQRGRRHRYGGWTRGRGTWSWRGMGPPLVVLISALFCVCPYIYIYLYLLTSNTLSTGFQILHSLICILFLMTSWCAFYLWSHSGTSENETRCVLRRIHDCWCYICCYYCNCYLLRPFYWHHTFLVQNRAVSQWFRNYYVIIWWYPFHRAAHKIVP